MSDKVLSPLDDLRERLQQITKLLQLHDLQLAALKKLLVRRAVFTQDEYAQEVQAIEERMIRLRREVAATERQEDLLDSLDDKDSTKM